MKRLLYFCRKATVHDFRIIEALQYKFHIDLIETDKESVQISEREYEGLVASPLSINLDGIPIKAKNIILMSMGYDLNEQSKENNLLEVMRSNVARANLVVIDNPNLQNQLISRLNYKGKIFFLPYGCKINEFVNIQSPNKRNLGTNRSMSKIHNNSTILEAIANLSAERYGKFVLVKHGPESQNFLQENQKFIERINHRIILGGQEAATKKFLAEIDIFISASRSDGSSVSLLEAMAARKVCIVASTLCNNYWIKDGINGFCFNNNVKDLLYKLNKALEMNEVERSLMVANARTKVESEANWNVNSLEFCEFVDSLTDIAEMRKSSRRL